MLAVLRGVLAVQSRFAKAARLVTAKSSTDLLRSSFIAATELACS